MSIAIMSLCDLHGKETENMRSLVLIAKSGIASLTFACASLLLAQASPPPPSPNNNGSVSGTISQLNYGAEMEVTSFLLNGNTLVTFPPHVGLALNSALKTGENVEVSGYSSPTPSGMQRVELQTISIGGKTLSVPQPGQFTSYSTSGKVIQLNYNREGDVDGFLLDNGVFAKTPPPSSAALSSMVSVGSQVSLTGYSHQTISGRTVVDTQSINGQAIAYAQPRPPQPPR
jgi:hypothetical protein